MALYYGIGRMGEAPAVGLPILAIFGIMILFGALALVATLFARLDLSDSNQPLALPEGSIRAAIALALIVLFAIISIMLYQTVSKPYPINGLGEAEKSAMVRDSANRVIAVVPEPCAVATAAPAQCAPENLRFTVHVVQPPGQESTDLAKQLLILIGTLMTSVTSFYFASRSLEPKRNGETPTAGGGTAAPLAGQSATAMVGDEVDDSHADGCDVPIGDATADEDLPAARGGVA
jgi:hypothetical protein